VDRWYIERFLADHKAWITGRVLEVKDSGYTDRFGTAVTERGVLDVDAGNPLATYMVDLATGDGLPADHFDCFILTQTLQYVFDVRAAVEQVRRTLRPEGTVLATLPVVSRITDPPLTDWWRFTPLAAWRLFADAFGEANVVVRGRGSVLTQVAFLEGLAIEELEPPHVVVDDERFPLIVTVCATKRLS
jgi:SAM-dependent methyltransferase